MMKRIEELEEKNEYLDNELEIKDREVREKDEEISKLLCERQGLTLDMNELKDLGDQRTSEINRLENELQALNMQKNSKIIEHSVTTKKSSANDDN